VQRFVEHGWVLAPLAVIIGVTSVPLLWVTLERGYFEYWLFPQQKAADGYIYPQTRYTIFDIVLILWCIDGLVASIMLFQRWISSRGISGWAHRTLVFYFLLFAVLILGGSLMMVARSHGY
jgi:hypothetical protein